MRRLALVITAVFAWAAVAGAAAEEVAGLPLHVKRLNPKTIRLWVGDHVSSTAVVAFGTSKGIVVVDTVGIPQLDAELREVIARELGRSDFQILINTHEHADHTGGNSVYGDVAIVGHEKLGPQLTARAGERPRLVEFYTNYSAELEKRLASHPTDSPEAQRLKEELTLHRLNFDVVKQDAKPVPPTQTFADRTTLDMGDTTFELYYIGGMHSASDIAVFVPEHGILLTGDTMADVWLTDTPGCLASFMARQGIPHDFPLLLANWDLLLAKKDRIRLLLPGHWNGELSLPGAAARVDYVRTLWEGIQRSAKEGKDFAGVLAEYQLEQRFPGLAKSPGFSARSHTGTVAEIWRVVTNQESAASKLYALLDEGASEAAMREVLTDRTAGRGKYFFMENDINGHGYRFLQQEKVDKAIALFKLNVELFPDSWNVYDSLGEALLKAGDTAGARKMYEKSLALNPDSTSGKEALAKLRAADASK